MKEIIIKAKQYMYSSMLYAQEEDLYDSKVLVNNDSILIIGTMENNTMKIDWATDNPNLLVESMITLEKDLLSNISANI